MRHKADKGTNLEDVLEINRSLILRLLRQTQASTRVELARASGLRQSTVTNIIHDLMNWNLVTETGTIHGNKGRRSISLSLDDRLYRVIGLRLARRFVSAGLFTLDGTLKSSRHQAIEPIEGYQQALATMKSLVADLLKECEGRVAGIGLATPGPLFRHQGRIALMTYFPGWDRVSIQEDLQRTFQLPVYIEHDANAAALAEWNFGPGTRRNGTMIYVAAGQGIGSGIIIDGVLYEGKLGTAGEIGHMSISLDGPRCECGHNGCLELYCSITALLRMIREELPTHSESTLARRASINAKDVFTAADAGDTLAREVVRKVGRFLGFGLVNVINVFNPQHIIIGDELAQAGPVLLEAVHESVKEHTLRQIYEDVSIELSTFSLDPVVVGASALVVEELLAKPSVLHDQFDKVKPTLNKLSENGIAEGS